MAERPRGTVTFLFTDVEGSTRLLRQLRGRYGVVLAEHARILREAFVAHGGEEVDTQGDAFFYVFSRARDAAAAAADGQRALVAHVWPEGAEFRVRMGLHTGEPVLSDEGRYHGMGLHRTQRIMAAGHGGQVLASQATASVLGDDELEGIALRDLGEHNLKDLDRPERIYQLEIAGLTNEFAPLKTDVPATATDELSAPRAPVYRRPVVIGSLAGVVAAAVAIPIFAFGGGSGGGQALAGVEANAVGAVDGSTGRLVASIPVGATPGAVAFGEGSIWVTNGDGHNVSRIDPTTNAVVQTIEVGSGPAGVAVGGGFVWVTNSLEGTVSKIDPNENNGSEVERLGVGNGPTGIAFGDGAVWVANSDDGTVTRIDPRSGAMRRITAGAGADAVAVGGGFVWVTSETDNSVTRISVRTGTVLPPIRVGNAPSAVAVGAGSAWVASSLDGTVFRIDPKRGSVAQVIPVGAGPAGISVTPGGVWVSNEGARTLSRISPARGRVVQTVKIENRPVGVASAGKALYVAVRTSGLAHRGGTLTVLVRDALGPLDPAGANGAFGFEAITLTNDGLTGYKRVGGSDGARLVPDLATSLPAPTDGGRTYTFQLRPGIRYSNGALVRPADFRRAFERSLVNPGGTSGYLSGIVGADRCMRTPKQCDLAQGIVADPAANTITFHLTTPDPDFLHKLTLPAAVAVPAGTPLHARLPLPATGPYMIANYNAKHGARLVRNPYFREWSAAAQPSGYPKQVMFRTSVSDKMRVRAAERGSADLIAVADILAALRTRYTSQLRANPAPITLYVFLNTRLPPFNKLEVRRAVNYAVDRNRAVELAGGSDVKQPSCQVLPPNFTGYRRYCPYTIDPRADGAYTGPDLAKARKLIAASGTRGQAVTVWVDPLFLGFLGGAGANFVSTLQSLGYRATLKVVPDKRYETIGDSRSKIQAGLLGWQSDYLSPSNFFDTLLSCRSYQPSSPNQLNVAAFCNRRIDAEIAQARSLQTTDPQAASQLWSKVDRDIVDQAPWVVLMNPRRTEFVSTRVGNYQYNPQWGGLLDQLWVVR